MIVNSAALVSWRATSFHGLLARQKILSDHVMHLALTTYGEDGSLELDRGGLGGGEWSQVILANLGSDTMIRGRPRPLEHPKGASPRNARVREWLEQVCLRSHSTLSRAVHSPGRGKEAGQIGAREPLVNSRLDFQRLLPQPLQ